MVATGNCTMVISNIQEAGKQANSVINAEYESYVSRLVVSQYLVMPHIRHLCVPLPLVICHIRHAHLGLHIALRLKGRTTCIWSFGCSFACATIVGCSGFKLSYGIIILL